MADKAQQQKAATQAALIQSLVGLGKAVTKALAAKGKTTTPAAQNGNLAGCGGCSTPGGGK